MDVANMTSLIGFWIPSFMFHQAPMIRCNITILVGDKECLVWLWNWLVTDKSLANEHSGFIP